MQGNSDLESTCGNTVALEKGDYASAPCSKSCTNDVFSPDFESKLDPYFRSDFSGDHKWMPDARTRPRLREIGKFWTSKVRWV